MLFGPCLSSFYYLEILYILYYNHANSIANFHFSANTVLLYSKLGDLGKLFYFYVGATLSDICTKFYVIAFS